MHEDYESLLLPCLVYFHCLRFVTGGLINVSVMVRCVAIVAPAPVHFFLDQVSEIGHADLVWWCLGIMASKKTRAGKENAKLVEWGAGESSLKWTKPLVARRVIRKKHVSVPKSLKPNPKRGRGRPRKTELASADKVDKASNLVDETCSGRCPRCLKVILYRCDHQTSSWTTPRPRPNPPLLRAAPPSEPKIWKHRSDPECKKAIKLLRQMKNKEVEVRVVLERVPVVEMSPEDFLDSESKQIIPSETPDEEIIFKIEVEEVLSDVPDEENNKTEPEPWIQTPKQGEEKESRDANTTDTGSPLQIQEFLLAIELDGKKQPELHVSNSEEDDKENRDTEAKGTGAAYGIDHDASLDEKEKLAPPLPLTTPASAQADDENEDVATAAELRSFLEEWLNELPSDNPDPELAPFPQTVDNVDLNEVLGTEVQSNEVNDDQLLDDLTIGDILALQLDSGFWNLVMNDEMSTGDTILKDAENYFRKFAKKIIQ